MPVASRPLPRRVGSGRNRSADERSARAVARTRDEASAFSGRRLLAIADLLHLALRMLFKLAPLSAGAAGTLRSNVGSQIGFAVAPADHLVVAVVQGVGGGGDRRGNGGGQERKQKVSTHVTVPSDQRPKLSRNARVVQEAAQCLTHESRRLRGAPAFHEAIGRQADMAAQADGPPEISAPVDPSEGAWPSRICCISFWVCSSSSRHW